MNETMLGAVLPGNSTVELKEFPIPEPAHGQVLIKTKSSTICGSDVRAIYREHVGKGPEGYQNKIAGHEPSGQIVAEGPGLKRFQKRGLRNSLSYFWMRCVQRLPARLYDKLYEFLPGSLRLAKGWRHGAVYPG